MNRILARLLRRLPAQGEEGIALLLVLMVVVAVGALTVAAISLNANTTLINSFDDRQEEMETVADAGLEAARSKLNATRTLFPDTGYVTIENGVAVTDATGRVIPNVKRYTYAGPIGVATGQYGVFGSIVSIAQYSNGDRVIRREDITQESFAKYAYFTNVEPSNISFGNGDVIQGPVHSNDILKVYDTRATFRGPGKVTTAKTISAGPNKSYATFVEGYQEYAGNIPMPPTADLARLYGYASSSGAAFTEPAGSAVNTARTRIEFLWIDVNLNSVADDDEGFFRVYSSTNDAYIMAQEPAGNGWLVSRNCGFWNAGPKAPLNRFITPADSVGSQNAAGIAAARRVADRSNRCYLGGDPALVDNNFASVQAGWVARPGSAGGIPAALNGRQDAAYLFSLSHDYNPNFKGVIHVTGSVALSGTLRGRVTVAATENILIADDLRYAIQPGVSADCASADMMGIFAGKDVVISDNALNTPQVLNDAAPLPNTKSLDDSNAGIFLQGVVLALNIFTVENYSTGPTNVNACEAVPWGRGCLYLSGGVIQYTRGAVWTDTGGTGGTGFLKRYSYDVCAAKRPPPYFPTTGRFSRSIFYQIDPVNFNVGSFFSGYRAG